MFEVGDRVVCVDDRPIEWFGRSYPVGISVGEKFTVLQVFCPPRQSGWAYDGTLRISIGRENLAGRALIADGRPFLWLGLDCWGIDRFRKLRDISQSLRELKELAINCPALADAGVRGGRG